MSPRLPFLRETGVPLVTTDRRLHAAPSVDVGIT